MISQLILSIEDSEIALHFKCGEEKAINYLLTTREKKSSTLNQLHLPPIQFHNSPQQNFLQNKIFRVPYENKNQTNLT